jgi:phosphate transport system protein
MLRELLAAFKKESKLDTAFDLVYESLGTAKHMFTESKSTFRQTGEDSGNAVAKQDRTINKAERSVRKNVLKHLAVSGGDHAVSALVLTSIIIDIERIGDYSKNIIELARKGPECPCMGDAEVDLNRVENAIEDTFDRLQVLLTGDKDSDAEKLIQEYFWVNPLLDQYVDQLLSGQLDDLSARDAVTLALYVRYLKRIFSHLRNMTTSVFRPFHKIGFVPSGMKNSQEVEV